jgi:hypothetical protein
MAQRIYVIALDTGDDEEPVEKQWEWFEDCVKQRVLETWNTTGRSDMGNMDLESYFDDEGRSTAIAHLMFDVLDGIAEED